MTKHVDVAWGRDDKILFQKYIYPNAIYVTAGKNKFKWSQNGSNTSFLCYEFFILTHFYHSGQMIACSLTMLIHILQENEPQKTQNLNKMLRKSPVSYAWAAIFQNVDFS